jgi:hypothetical protein
MKSINEPKVFVSYSWDDDSHCEWVTNLAGRLMVNGIKVFLDRFDVFLGSNLEKFMDEGLNESRYVICICSDGYYKKFNTKGTGVQKENCLIKSLERSDFVIPVLKNNKSKLIPDGLGEIFYADFDKSDDDKEFEKIISRVFGEDKKTVPFVGRNPFEKEIANKHILEAKIQSSAYINLSFKNTVNFNYSNNCGTFIIGSGEYSFTTKWSKAGNTRIHAYNDLVKNIALVKNQKSLDDLTSTEGLDFTSRSRTSQKGDCIIWINEYGNIANTRIVGIKDDRTDSQDEVIFEYKIYKKQI